MQEDDIEVLHELDREVTKGESGRNQRCAYKNLFTDGDVTHIVRDARLVGEPGIHWD